MYVVSVCVVVFHVSVIELPFVDIAVNVSGGLGMYLFLVVNVYVALV